MTNRLRALAERASFVLSAAAAGAAALALAPGASAAAGTPGSLCANPFVCPGTTALVRHNSTHYKLPVGTGGVFAIVGATDVSPGPVDVIVKSSTLGNTTVPGVAAPDPLHGITITFAYTAPANGCDTSVVAYVAPGNVTNNDVVDDGLLNGSGTSVGGFAFTNASGTVIACSATAPPVPLTGTASATPDFTRAFAWSLAKSVDRARYATPEGTTATVGYTVTASHDAGTDSGWSVAGSVEVANPNATAVSGVTVSGALGPSATCTVSGSGTTIAGSGTASFPFSCTFAAAPTSAAEAFVATISWPAQGALAAGSATATTPVSWTTPTHVVDGTASVTDTMAGFLGTASATSPPSAFVYTQALGGTAGTCTGYGNTATLTTDTTATSTSASASTTVCVGSDLGASAALVPTFARTYGWTVAKSVDKTVVKQFGGTATFTYTVNAAETGFTDSGWTAGGTVVVTNPNDWEAVPVHVTAAVDSGGTCTVTGGDVTVPASGSVELPVTCTWATAPSPGAGTATVTASWDAAPAATPHGTAAATTPADFTTVDPNRVAPTVDVSDSFAGALGTLAATDTAPYAAATYTYSRAIAVPTWNCQTFGNTATLVQTGQSASQSVRVCGPARTGALTIGFWQNKNGQAILTGGSSTGGVCNVATWLRGYAPFADLSATATCAQTAAWVTTVIKAANASGASMNAMLKAQMLATALDVYFSDASLGGNKIAAPGPAGPVAIDVSAWGGAFGGATSLTVSQMLAAAAAQSSSGGTTWYANVKSVQELAKNAFDAVDNQRAFPA